MAEHLAPLMLLALVPAILCGAPVAFMLMACAFVFGLAGIAAGVLPPPLVQALPLRLYGLIANESLLAIPFFTFMGLALQRSGLAEELLATVAELCGPVRGGLALAVIGVGTLLAATTGVVAASVVSMGLISLPVMLRHGYDPRVACGVIAASGTLTQVVPPSLVLIVLAEQLGRSAGDLYAGVLAPAALLVAAYAGWIAVVALLWPQRVPAVPRAVGALRRAARMLAPPLAIVGLVAGSIIGGFASATESGALGAIAAGALGAARRRLPWREAARCLLDTSRLTAMVMLLLFASNAFSLVFQALDGNRWVERLLVALPGGATGFLAFVTVLVFVLGCFLDFYEIAFVLVPLLVAPAQALGIDLVWLGVLLGINLQTSFMTPPFGFALLFLRGAAPVASAAGGAGVRSADIYAGVLPFVGLQVAVMAAVIAFPALVLDAVRPPRAPLDDATVERLLHRMLDEAEAQETPDALRMLLEVNRQPR